MYHGTTTETVKQWRDRYQPGIGNISTVAGMGEKTLHVYTCDNCGQEHRVIEPADERFFCSNCRQLAVTI